jgi:hypothetical protein
MTKFEWSAMLLDHCRCCRDYFVQEGGAWNDMVVRRNTTQRYFSMVQFCQGLVELMNVNIKNQKYSVKFSPKETISEHRFGVRQNTVDKKIYHVIYDFFLWCEFGIFLLLLR